MEIRDPGLLRDAVKVALSMEKVSASKIQRKARVGWATAARLLDELTGLGIIGERDAKGWCEVLAGEEDARRILERAGIGAGQWGWHRTSPRSSVPAARRRQG
jgi:hypothetical protein